MAYCGTLDNKLEQNIEDSTKYSISTETFTYDAVTLSRGKGPVAIIFYAKIEKDFDLVDNVGKNWSLYFSHPRLLHQYQTDP